MKKRKRVNAHRVLRIEPDVASPNVLVGKGGNYEEKLLQIALKNPGDLAYATIRHDSWCGIYDRKPCNCEPDVVVEKF